jgi:hypothetical protein
VAPGCVIGNTPHSAAEIIDRLNEISLNFPLAKELRMIALLRQVADPGTGEGARWAQMRTHLIKSTDRIAMVVVGLDNRRSVDDRFD